MERIKVYKVKPILTDREADMLAGQMLRQDHCSLLLEEPCDIYDSETGKCLAKYRKNVIPMDVVSKAYLALLSAAKGTSNRGVGTGLLEDGRTVKKRRRLLDGSLSNTNIAGEIVDSGIIGYFDRGPRFPYCRTTAFNQQHLEKFKKATSIIKLVDEQYAKLMPREYKLQRELADHTSQDFVIKGTAFTTVTVNKNWQTAVHKDAGDYKYGFGNLTALRDGTFSGGHLCLPKWGVGFDLRNGDLLLMDVHQWHGNTPIVLDDPKAVRLSLVMYYRENMIHCGTMEKELDRVKNRRKGEKLN